MSALVNARVTLYTFAEGLMSRLAHDLALEATPRETTLDRADGGGRAELVFHSDDIRILGAVKGASVDPGVLSPADRRDILGKITDAISRGEIRTTVTLDGGRATVRLVLPCGQGSASCNLDTTGDSRAGKVTFSLRALGVKPVKGPLNAFRLADRLVAEFTADVPSRTDP